MTCSVTRAGLSIEVVVLDMAGTTIRDDGAVVAAFITAMHRLGITETDPRFGPAIAYVRDTMGRSKIEVFRHIFGDESQAIKANALFEDAYSTWLVADGAQPIPGAEATIQVLRQSGMKVCLTTGFSAATRDQLIQNVGWQLLVDLALSPGEAGRGRPHPDLVLRAALELGASDVRAVAAVGDTTSDLLAGWRAGAGVVAGVLTGAHSRAQLESAPHTHILDSIADLPAVLNDLDTPPETSP